MIIGISGKRGVGKTTLANLICGHYPVSGRSFAHELKTLAKTIFDFSYKDFSDPIKKEQPWDFYDWTPRDFLIDFGQFVRKYDVDYWAKKVILNCKSERIYTIDDVRFPNEYDMIKAYGGLVIRLERGPEYNVYKDTIDDPSETALDNYKFDYVFKNEGTKESLKEFGDKVYGEAKRKMLPMPDRI